MAIPSRRFAISFLLSLAHLCCIGPHVYAQDTAYFYVFPATGVQIWKTKGTFDSTQRVASSTEFRGNPLFLGRVGDAVLLTDNVQGGLGLLAIDPESNQLRKVSRRVNPVFAGGSGNEFILFDSEAANGSESLWRSDATETGTKLVSPLIGSWFFLVPKSQAPLGGNVLFTGRRPNQRFSLLAFNGTSVEPREIKGLYAGREVSVAASSFTLCNNIVFFIGFVNDRQIIWITDGTIEGTHPFKSLENMQRAAPVTCSDGRLYFSTSLGSISALWEASTDGAKPTKLLDQSVGEIVPIKGGVVVERRVGMSAALWFASHDRTHKIIDGKQRGFEPIAPLNDEVIFASPNGGLMITDGSASGTKQISDTNLSLVGTSVSVRTPLRFDPREPDKQERGQIIVIGSK